MAYSIGKYLIRAKNKYSAMPVQARASFWYLISSFLQKGISVITTPIFTRLLTTEEYGQFNVFNSWLGIVAVFVTLRLYFGVYSQALVKFDDDRDGFTAAMVGLTCTLTAAWMLVYFVLMDFWNFLFGLTTSQMIAMFLTIWTEAIFSFWAARQRVEYTYKRLIVLTIGVSVAKPAFGILAVLYFSDRVTARIWELALVELLAYIGLFFTQVRCGRLFSAEAWRYALGFNIPLIPHYLSQTILNSSDRIMIERYDGPGPAGIYSLAVSIAQLMSLFNTALNQTIGPWIYQKIKVDKSQDIGRVVYPSVLLVGVLNLFLIGLAPEVVWFFAPQSYHDAVWAIPPIAMSVYFIHLYNVYSSFEFYYEKPMFIAVSTAFAAVLNITLNLLLLPVFGYLAAGYTTLLSYMAYAFMHSMFSSKVCKEKTGTVPLEFSVLSGYSFVFLVGGALMTLTYHATLIRWTVIIASFVAALVQWKRIVAYVATLLKTRERRE